MLNAHLQHTGNMVFLLPSYFFISFQRMHLFLFYQLHPFFSRYGIIGVYLKTHSDVFGRCPVLID